MADPYDFLGSSKQEAAPRKIVPVTDLFPTAEDWAKPASAPAPQREPTLADDNSFLQNAAIGAVEAAKELGTGAELWGRRLGGDPNVQRDIAAEKARRAMYAPVKQTWGGMLGAGAPAIAAGALTAPVGLPSYLVNAGLNALPELDTDQMVLQGALSVPATALGNAAGQVLGRGASAAVGKMDPTKANVLATEEALRASGDKGLPLRAFRSPAKDVAAFDEAIQRAHPLDALNRIKAAADTTNKDLWQKVTDIATANKSIIDIDPTNTLSGMNRVLSVIEKPKLVGENVVNTNYVRSLIDDLKSGTKSFDQMRDVQKAIGEALGEAARNPKADRQAVAALRDAYEGVITDMQHTGNKTVDKQLGDALKKASVHHKTEVLPFRTGEVEGARNPILAKYANGNYANDPSLILADLLKPTERAGFGSFAYPRLDPLEAATVQKIFADPKMVAKIRSSQTPVEQSPGFMKRAVDWVNETQSPFAKRIVAANPKALEDTTMRPISRALVGGLRQGFSGPRAATGLEGLVEGTKATVGPLFRVFEEQKQPTYVSGQ